ncbi:MAG: exo-alpha-sialidase [Clostridia bacterium]|nr:exo-alpha-sialidase [Clostridia bacterium]
MKTVILERNRENGYHIYNIPGITVTADGAALVYYECRHGGDWSVTDIAVRRSMDGGNTFSDRKIVVSGKGHNTVHGFMSFAGNGKIYAVYCENYHRAFVIESVDDGITWSAPSEITYAFEKAREQYNWQVICTGPGHGIITSSGTMMCGVWLASNLADRNKHYPSRMATLYSKDGIMWEIGDLLPSTQDFFNPSESVLAERSDGKIYRNFRHDGPHRRRGITVSDDGIGSWSDYVFDEDLPDPICAAGLTSANGKFLFTNCATDGEGLRDARKFLTLRTGRDGKKWDKSLLIDENGGYSDVAYLPSDGSVLVVYNGGRMPDATDWWHYEGIKVAKIARGELD